ncbi:MAG: sn-glycerol-1-phosphate dehydrogenase [Eubacterium sp.]|nr:sn-glycerol-1-phosphate dehydrogenase [Eubacterium sp.]
MDVQELLKKGTFDCECGRTHQCDTKHLLVGRGVLEQIPGLLREDGITHVCVLSDGNTRPLCGAKVIDLLKADGVTVDEAYFDQTEVVVPDEKSIAYADSFIKDGAQLVIGVGGGVMNDLSKYVAYEHDIPSMIVATAPSMDGFAASGAVMLLKGLKVTVNRRAPRFIVGELDILKDAPIDMIRSGIGDTLGKYSALSDWKLAILMGEEEPCQMIYDLVEESLTNCANNIDAIMRRDPDAIGKLMEGLAVVGITLAYQKSSRPASGSEHMISHFFELTCIKNHRPYFPHGIDVGYAAIVSEILRKRLLQEDPDSFAFSFDRAAWRAGLEECFSDMADEIQKMQDDNGTYEKDRSGFIRENWDTIRPMLEQTPGVDFIREKLRRAGFNIQEFIDLYGLDHIKNAVRYASDIKTRYTLLSLLSDTGYLEQYASELEL